MITSIVLLLAPFAAYLPAEALHVSGVLAAVSAGSLLSRRSSNFLDSGIARFGVVGLASFDLHPQRVRFSFDRLASLPAILEALEPHVRDYVLYGLLLSVTVIIVRIAWVFPGDVSGAAISTGLRAQRSVSIWRNVAVLSWAGMRGIVSLAIALDSRIRSETSRFLQRSVMIFFTFCVVFVTLVLPRLDTWAADRATGRDRDEPQGQRGAALRIRALEAGIARLRDEEARAKEPARARNCRSHPRRVSPANRRPSRKSRRRTNQTSARESRLDRIVQKSALGAERRAIVADAPRRRDSRRDLSLDRVRPRSRDPSP